MVRSAGIDLSRRSNTILRAAAVLLMVAAACRAPASAPAGGPPSPSRTGADADPVLDRGELTDVLPRDAIPSIDAPRFVAPEEVDWLAGREPVVSLEIAGDARAYPVQIMTRHEIVNDEVGGRPVAVTYCPLCNSALVFERAVAGRVLEFGVSGKLYLSALVMYDRQTDSLWTQFRGEAVDGPMTGTSLDHIPAQMLSFDEWRRAYPAGRVLSRQTGFDIDYGTNPYERYDRLDGPYGHFFQEAVDDRLPAMERVVALPIGRGMAYAYRDLVDRDAGVAVIADRVAGEDVVVFWRAGTASALDSVEISEGRDVGATGVFSPMLGGRRLTFTAAAGRIADTDTRSTWSLAGVAETGPLQGARLEPIEHLDTFWFAWQAYHPGTRVHRSRGGR